MKKPNLQFVKDRLLELDPSLQGAEDSDCYKTALVVLSALACGPSTARLEKFTGLSQELINLISQRMIQAELWTDSHTRCDHWFLSDSLFSSSAFWADVLVAEGLVVRQWVGDEGQYHYWDKDFAPQTAKHRES